MFSPRWLFLYPGAAIFMIGLVGTLILFFTNIVVGSVGFAEHTIMMTAAGINIGFQSMLFWAKVIAVKRGLLLRDPLFERLRHAMPLERGVAIGATLLVLGLVAFGFAFGGWLRAGFGELNSGGPIRLVIASATTLVLGAQILFGSFFLYLLDFASSGNRRILKSAREGGRKRGNAGPRFSKRRSIAATRAVAARSIRNPPASCCVNPVKQASAAAVQN